MISKEEVKHIAGLSRLKFNDEEIENFIKKFSQVLDYVEKLKEVNTENIQPTYQVNEKSYEVLREDVAKKSITRDEAISNAPEQQFGYFKLPKVIE